MFIDSIYFPQIFPFLFRWYYAGPVLQGNLWFSGYKIVHRTLRTPKWLNEKENIKFFCRIAVMSLECYVCTDQDGNTEKCLTTIKTCDYHHDRYDDAGEW